MGTRCQIKLKSDDQHYKERWPDCLKIHIYKHWDGYPEGVLPVLYPFVKDFHQNRGCTDAPYLLAQIVREFARKIDGEPHTGWGIDLIKHGDIDFLYEVDSKGQIFVTDYEDKTFLVTKEKFKEICGG